MSKSKAKQCSVVLDLNLPTKWSQLSAEQVMRVAYYLSRRMEPTEYLVLLGLEFAGLHPHGTVERDGNILYAYYHRDRGNVLLTAEQVAGIASALEWTTREPEGMAAPMLDGYSAPDSKMYGVTLEQFITAETACSAYIRLQDERALRTMVVSLYTRKKGFDPEHLDREAERIKYLPLWQMQAVFLWFAGAKKMLMDKYPYVFSASESGGGSIPGDEMMLGLLSSLNEGRIVDNDKIKRADLHEVFYELNQKIKNSKKSNV